MSEQPDANKELFAHLIILLASSTMQHLGKVMNPMTQKAEVNLEAAQSTIDLIDMLEAKTRGNLDKDEDRFVKTTLAQLKMNYVETANETPAQEAKKPEAVAAASEPNVTAPPPSDDEKKKFHKKYG